MYALDPSWGLDKPARRVAHRAFMGSAAIVMICGYVCIIVAHSTGGKRSYFGYDFVTHEWANWKRVAHGWIGFVTILCVLAQGVMGAKKLKALTVSGQRIFTFHGQMGKVIISMSVLNILLAVAFWDSWSTVMKTAIVLLVLFLGAIGTVWPKAEEPLQQGDGEKGENGETVGLMEHSRVD